MYRLSRYINFILMNEQNEALREQMEDEFDQAEKEGRIVYVKNLSDREFEILTERAREDDGVVELFRDGEVFAFEIIPEVIED